VVQTQPLVDRWGRKQRSVDSRLQLRRRETHGLKETARLSTISKQLQISYLAVIFFLHLCTRRRGAALCPAPVPNQPNKSKMYHDAPKLRKRLALRVHIKTISAGFRRSRPLNSTCPCVCLLGPLPRHRPRPSCCSCSLQECLGIPASCVSCRRDPA
jgi:hypothetical protein